MNNVQRSADYRQVCVWPGTIVEPHEIKDFEEFFLTEMNVRVVYLESIATEPDYDDLGNDINGTGGRHDVFFAVHNEDVGSFAVPRLMMGIRWIEDVLSPNNYHCDIYPQRVHEYKTW